MRRIARALFLCAWIPAAGFALETQSAEPVDTIQTGTVYAYGHELKPPYILDVVGGTLLINGVQVYPDLSQVREEEEKPPREISEWTKKVMPVYRAVWALERKLEAEEVPASEITARDVEELWSRVVYEPSGGDLLDTIDELHTLNNFGKQFISIEFPPSLLSAPA